MPVSGMAMSNSRPKLAANPLSSRPRALSSISTGFSLSTHQARQLLLQSSSRDAHIAS
jgi:hypothetical protein